MLCSQCSEIQNKYKKLYHPGSTDGELSHLRGKPKKPDVSHKTEPHLPLSSRQCASGQTELWRLTLEMRGKYFICTSKPLLYGSVISTAQCAPHGHILSK